jgi:hypothetical protein
MPTDAQGSLESRILGPLGVRTISWPGLRETTATHRKAPCLGLPLRV